MRHTINLLVTQKKYQEIDKRVNNFKLLLLFFSTAFCLVSITLLTLTLSQKNSLDALLNEKKQLLEFLVANKDTEIKFELLKGKNDQLANLLKNDISFSVFYNNLLQSLDSSNTGGQLDAITIDNKRVAEFKVIFPDQESLEGFIQFVETSDLLDLFEQLNLDAVTIKNEASEQENVLSFKGTFAKQ